MLAANYFSRIHALSQDPWELRTRWHESRKRCITRAALPRRHYDAALERDRLLLRRGRARQHRRALPVSLRSSGTLLGCHWRHRVDHRSLNGNRVQAIIGEVAGLCSWVRHVEDDFRLDVWCDADESIARDEALL